MESNSEKIAFSKDDQTQIKIGKTEYIVNAHYADSMTLFEKLLRLMIKDIDKNWKPEGATLPYIPFQKLRRNLQCKTKIINNFQQHGL